MDGESNLDGLENARVRRPHATLALALLAALGVAIAGCGSGGSFNTTRVTNASVNTSSSSSLESPGSHSSASTGAVEPTASASNASATEVPNVCSLLSDQQIDAAFGAGWVPVTYDGLANGYLPDWILSKTASHYWVHQLDPSIQVLADAACNWKNDKVSLGEGVHPTLLLHLATFSASVPEALFLREYAPRKPYPAGFGPVAGLGRWAYFNQSGDELVASVGNKLLLISNPDIAGGSLRAGYTQLARIVMGKLE
jgi:hypothetical protein